MFGAERGPDDVEAAGLELPPAAAAPRRLPELHAEPVRVVGVPPQPHRRPDLLIIIKNQKKESTIQKIKVIFSVPRIRKSYEGAQNKK